MCCLRNLTTIIDRRSTVPEGRPKMYVYQQTCFEGEGFTWRRAQDPYSWAPPTQTFLRGARCVVCARAQTIDQHSTAPETRQSSDGVRRGRVTPTAPFDPGGRENATRRDGGHDYVHGGNRRRVVIQCISELIVNDRARSTRLSNAVAVAVGNISRPALEVLCQGKDRTHFNQALCTATIARVYISP